MKKSLLLIALSFLLLFGGCVPSAPEKAEEKTVKKAEEYITGVWISYVELDNMVQKGSFANSFQSVINNCKDLKITDIFLHVVPFCDAAYSSDIYNKRYNEDILKIAVKLCHKNDMRIHAWINPYRVRTADGNIQNLDKNSIVYKWLSDGAPENDDNICFWNNGIYLNPAADGAKQTIIGIVREICKGYDIDGIHIDDYFYPTTDDEFDRKTYADYKKLTENPLCVADFRRANVNALISGIYTAIKFIDKDILFSISPAADIEKNKETFFADISEWCKSGCVDMIIPQLYFGFEYKNSRFCFDNILSEWKTMLNGLNTKLLIGLACYKTGSETMEDGNEWAIRDDILSRQTEICLSDDRVGGQIFYSYSSLFSEDELNKNAKEKIKTALKGKNNN